MTNRMLIDANHPEETRVVILDGSKVEEFDFEAASKRPLKGNIYLAKVTRVEPSLQAAFVEYGGNRQGFLAFAEIHPDYYQIPVADRQALIAEQEAEARRRSEDDIESFEITGNKDIKTEDLQKSLRNVGLAAGKTFDRSRENFPMLDQGVSALVEDLHDLILGAVRDLGHLGARLKFEGNANAALEIESEVNLLLNWGDRPNTKCDDHY